MDSSQIASLIGAFCILTGYVGLQTARFAEQSLVYLGLNFVGGSLLLYAAVETGNFGFILLEGAWVGVTCLGFWRRFNRTKK